MFDREGGQKSETNSPAQARRIFPLRDSREALLETEVTRFWQRNPAERRSGSDFSVYQKVLKMGWSSRIFRGLSRRNGRDLEEQIFASRVPPRRFTLSRQLEPSPDSAVLVR